MKVLVLGSALFAWCLLVQSMGGCGGSTSSVSGSGDGGDDGSAAGGPRGADGTIVADGGTGVGDAGPGGSTSSLPCGTASCIIPSESCCVTDVGGGVSFACVVGAKCPAAAPSGDGGGQSGQGNVVALKCTSAANCAAGTVCCVSAKNNDTTSACLAACAPGDAQLCDVNATPTGCAATDPCSSKNISDWGLPPSFATCGGKGN